MGGALKEREAEEGRLRRAARDRLPSRGAATYPEYRTAQKVV